MANRGEVLDLPDGQEGRSPAIIRPVRVLSTAALAATLPCGATGASAKTTWLCKPGLKHS